MSSNFGDNFVEQLKNKISISDIVGRYTKLIKRGDKYVGCCPFHKEKTPSFYVYEHNDSYHCYGCKVHGDIFTILMEKKGFSFREALEEFADLAGLKIPSISKESQEQYDKSILYYEILEKTTKYYESNLSNSVGSVARNYLENRKINSDIIKKFRLGFAGKNNGLLKHLLQAGYTNNDLEILGLIKKSSKDESYYDYFRSRIVFPIFDIRSRVVGFGGRVIDKGEPKYLNSPETPLYNKGSIAYGYNFAKENILSNKETCLICCEGYLDVIALHQHGFGGAVAPLGTSFTKPQLDLLWKIYPVPILSFDGDMAGNKAAFRAMEMVMPLIKPGYSLKFANIPAGSDPDDLLQNNKKELLENIYKNAETLVDKFWFSMTDGIAVETHEQKTLFKKQIYESLEKIEDSGVRRDYNFEINKRIGDYFRSLYKNNSQAVNIRNYSSYSNLGKIVSNSHDRQIQLLLACIINNERILPVVENELMELDTKNTNLRKLIDEILNYSNANTDKNLKDYLLDSDLDNIVTGICSPQVYIHGKFAAPNKNVDDYDELIRLWRNVHKLTVHQNKMSSDLLRAIVLFKENPTFDNQERLRKIQKELFAIDNEIKCVDQ